MPKQTETGLSRTTVTDRSGEYLLLELPVGHYRVQVEGKGFQTYIQQGIILDVNETAMFRFVWRWVLRPNM